MSSPSLNIYSVKSWENAGAYAELLGSLPSSFSSIIRPLMIDELRGKEKSDDTVVYQAVRLLKSPSLKAIFYYCGITFDKEDFFAIDKLNERKIVRYFPRSALCAILTCSYLYKRCAKLSDPAEWEIVSSLIDHDVDLGIVIGKTIPRISPFVGILIGSLHYFGFIAFSLHDLKGFKEYRRYLKKNNLFIDVKYEEERWGCSSLQIGSILMQQAGFGRDFAQQYAIGANPEIDLGKVYDNEIYRFGICRIWIESLKNSGKAPDITHRGAFYPLKEDLEKLEETAKKINENKSLYRWLNKSKDDISAEKTPQLFYGGRPQEAKDEEAVEELNDF